MKDFSFQYNWYANINFEHMKTLHWGHRYVRLSGVTKVEILWWIRNYVPIQDRLDFIDMCNMGGEL